MTNNKVLFIKMNKPQLILILAAIVFQFNCHKSIDSIIHINCAFLFTDTTGTNDSGRIYMPNAFTPDFSTINDYCFPTTVNISTIDFSIYDDLNNIVFSTTQLGDGWTTAPYPIHNTIYYYRIQAVTTGNHKIGVCGEINSLKCIPRGKTLNDFLFPDQIAPNGIIYPTHEIIVNCP